MEKFPSDTGTPRSRSSMLRFVSRRYSLLSAVLARVIHRYTLALSLAGNCLANEGGEHLLHAAYAEPRKRAIWNKTPNDARHCWERESAVKPCKGLRNTRFSGGLRHTIRMLLVSFVFHSCTASGKCSGHDLHG